MKPIIQQMRDGNIATLRRNGDYFVRNDYFTGIPLFYSLDGDPIPLASAICLHCRDMIVCTNPGDTRTCLCGRISVHTDKEQPMKHGYKGHMGDMEIVS